MQSAYRLAWAFTPLGWKIDRHINKQSVIKDGEVLKLAGWGSNPDIYDADAVAYQLGNQVNWEKVVMRMIWT